MNAELTPILNDNKTYKDEFDHLFYVAPESAVFEATATAAAFNKLNPGIDSSSSSSSSSSTTIVDYWPTDRAQSDANTKSRNNSKQNRTSKRKSRKLKKMKKNENNDEQPPKQTEQPPKNATNNCCTKASASRS